MNPLTVYPAHLHTITGPRHLALDHFKRYGVALWLRANGSATLFFRDSLGVSRQKTWAKTRIGGKR